MFNYWNRKNTIEAKMMDITFAIMNKNNANLFLYYDLLQPLFEGINMELYHFAPVIRKLHPERFPF
jgi:hypothetical protein